MPPAPDSSCQCGPFDALPACNQAWLHRECLRLRIGRLAGTVAYETGCAVVEAWRAVKAELSCSRERRRIGRALVLAVLIVAAAFVILT